MTILCKAKLQNTEEQALVNELNTVATDAGIVQTLIRRQPTSFGAMAKPYKVCKRKGVVTLDINLGSWHHYALNFGVSTDKVKAFVNSAKVQKYVRETA
jgi:hypothetical protein